MTTRVFIHFDRDPDEFKAEARAQSYESDSEKYIALHLTDLTVFLSPEQAIAIRKVLGDAYLEATDK